MILKNVKMAIQLMGTDEVQHVKLKICGAVMEVMEIVKIPV